MKIISVDLQREFTTPKGACYVPGKAVEFILETLIPHLRDRGIKLAEIISDYRQPRPGDRRDCLYPGTEMYLSEIPEDVKDRPVWVKCMNSPAWVRENIGVAGAPPTPTQRHLTIGLRGWWGRRMCCLLDSPLTGVSLPPHRSSHTGDTGSSSSPRAPTPPPATPGRRNTSSLIPPSSTGQRPLSGRGRGDFFNRPLRGSFLRC